MSVCAAAFAVSLAFVDFALYREYVVKILPTIAGSDPSRYNQTPLRFWYQYPNVVRVASLLGDAATVFLAWVAGRNSGRLSDGDRLVDTGTERNAVLLLAVLLMLLFSPLAWQMAYAMTIVPVAVLLVAAPPRTAPWAPVGLVVGAAFMSSQIYNVQVLNLLNVLGAGIAVLCLILYYLPLRAAGASSLEG